jgi:lipopolysaccharide/colanic/teichoic acid biosynthesis glycosyltransferase
MPPAPPPGLLRRIDSVAKRGLDLLVASLGLGVSWPFLVILAVLVKLDSPGPALYQAARIGRDGREFRMVKFRTMRVGADGGPGITGAADARVTRVGRWLRATRLDEMPQLFNVLRGDMSLVGPRPESPRYVRYYTPEQRAVWSVLPGITGPTQLRFRDEAAWLTDADVEAQYVRDLLPAKLASDLAYVRGRTLWLDIRLLLETAMLIIRRS